MDKYRRGVFVVVYAKDRNGKIEYLILKRKHHWKGWEFPKGGAKIFEVKRCAVKRETREESGLKILRIKKFNIHGRYKYNKKFKDRKGLAGQTFSLFSAEVKKGRVKIDKIEHSGYEWVEFNEAMKKLKWNNQKKCLKTVNNWLIK